VEVNGGVPVHIDESFDKRTQHERISNSNEFRVKSSSFITAVVADPKHMERIDGGAVSANLLGECIDHDPGGSQNKRNVGDGPQDVKPKVVFLARNLSVITISNAKLCSERSIRGGEGRDYHGRLNAEGASYWSSRALQEQGASQQDIDVQPQNRCVVGEDIAPAIFSFNVTTFGPSVEKNHLEVCTELQRPWQEDNSSYAAKLDRLAEWYQQLKTDKPKAYAAKLNAAVSRKKKKKEKKPPCPGSVHGLALPCTECDSIWCRSK
jgi:hypothetical protein